MDTTTQATSPEQEPENASCCAGRWKVLGGLVIAAVAIWACAGLLTELYSFELAQEYKRKVDLAPTTELDAVRAGEQQDLYPADGRTIDSTIEEYINKK